jgi:hypothetical protein
MSQTGEMTGEIWEGYGRDSRHLSHALSLLYKGLSKNYGRDDRYLGFYILPKKYYCDRFRLMRQVCRNIVFVSPQPMKKLRKKLGM